METRIDQAVYEYLKHTLNPDFRFNEEVQLLLDVTRRAFDIDIMDIAESLPGDTGFYFSYTSVKEGIPDHLFSSVKVPNADYVNLLKLYDGRGLADTFVSSFSGSLADGGILHYGFRHHSTFFGMVGFQSLSRRVWTEEEKEALIKVGKAIEPHFELRLATNMTNKYLQQGEQFRQAILKDNVFCYSFNVTTGIIDEDIVSFGGDGRVSLLERAGLQVPCRYDDFMRLSMNFSTPETYANVLPIVTCQSLLDLYHQGQTYFNCEYVIADSNGSFRNTLQSNVLTKDSNTGDIICIAYGKDVTSERQKEKEEKENLRKTTHHLRQQNQIAASLGNLYFATYYINVQKDTYIEVKAPKLIHDVGGKEPAANKAMNMVIDALVCDDYQQDMKDFVCLSTLGDRMRNSFQITREFEGKHLGWCRASFIVSEKDEEDTLEHVVFCVQIIDEEKMNELENKKKLEEALEEAKSASQAKTDFLSRMSHDMRTPMNVIIGLTALAEKHIDDRKAVLDSLDKIGLSSKQLLSLINDVLDMNKIESAKIDLLREPFNVHELVSELEMMMHEQIVDNNLTYDKEIGPLEHPDLFGSVLHVKQILINIFSNAVKYNKPFGSIHFRTEELQSPGNRTLLAFTISDTGIGMKKEFISHIYDPFAQENEGARTKYKGTGLGMSICKKLVDLMDGTIEVSSVYGEGSSFRVILPFEINTSPETLKKETKKAEKVIDLQGKRVLLVEDNILNMEIETALLQELGLIIDKAENGKIAMEKFMLSEKDHYAAILMDVRMPVMDGMTATREIRKLPRSDAKEIPIIAMTADAFAEDVKKVKEAGMNVHLSKPLDMKLVTKTLSRYLH